MIGDKEKILLGILSECSSSRIIESSSSHIKRELVFQDKKFLLIEEFIDSNLVWRIFDEERELERSEIVDLYAEFNLKRLMKK